jgi:UDP-glucose 4-epimerase
MAAVVLLTGVSRYLGGRMARLLSNADGVERIIGVDVIPPPHDIGRAEFVQADIRNPTVAKVLTRASVDTVLHMGVIATPTQAGGRAAMKEINVIGTMQLLAACQRAESVRTLVVKSTSSVYGAGPRDPAMFTEDMEPRHPPTSGWAKDSTEVEGYVRGFARRRSDVTVTTLRFANFIGPGIVTSMTEYFGLPVVPTVLGYDPRMQFVHEDDGLDILQRVTLEPCPGTFNVAGPGVLTLSQAVRRAGRFALPVPVAALGTIGRSTKVDLTREQVRFLTYGRVLDTARIERRLGFVPRWSTAAAFDDYVRHSGRPRGEVA